jgi:tetratricopeptide (TPR) repeat protein
MTARSIRRRVPWLLLTVSLLLVVWSVPWNSIVHRQVGTRAFLQMVLRDTPLADHAGRAVSPASGGREAVLSQLSQSDGKPGIYERDLDAYRTLGVVALAANNPAQAQQWLIQRLEVAPTDVVARYFLGEAYLRMGDTQAAIREWQAAGAERQLTGMAEKLVEHEEWTEAMTALDGAMQLNASNANSRWLAAEICNKQGETERALALYEEVIALVPQTIGARQRAAELWIERGDTQRALTLYQEIIALTPEEPNGYALSGILFLNTGEYERAAALFEQALERDPSRPRWLLIRSGMTYAALEKWHEAIDAYQEAIHQEPGYYWDYVLMGDAQCRIRHPQEALIYYQEAVALGNERTSVPATIEHIAQYGECPP